MALVAATAAAPVAMIFRAFLRGMDSFIVNGAVIKILGAEVAKDKKMSYNAANVYKKESFILP